MILKTSRFLIVFAGLILAPLGMATEIDSTFCEQEFLNNGQGKLESQCLELGFKSAKLTLPFESITLGVSDFALFLKDNKTEEIQLLSGDQTRLEHPVAVDWNEEAKEIYVLLQNGNINIYHDFVLGNIAPKRIIKNKELPGSTALNAGSNSIVILNPLTNRVLTFNREANSRAPAGYQKDSILNTVETPLGSKFQKIAIDDSSSQKRIFLSNDKGEVFEKVGQNLKKLSVSSVASGSEIQALHYDPQKRALNIRTLQGIEEVQLP